MIWAHACVNTEILERRQLVDVALDVTASSPNHLYLRVSHRGAARATTAARTKACTFGGFGKAKENDLLAARTARRARGPAVDSSRAHPEKDPSIKVCVSFEHCAPECFVGGGLRALISTSLLAQCYGLAHFSCLHEHTKAELEIESIRI